MFVSAATCSCVVLTCHLEWQFEQLFGRLELWKKYKDVKLNNRVINQLSQCVITSETDGKIVRCAQDMLWNVLQAN